MRQILRTTCLAATLCVGLTRSTAADEPTDVARSIYPPQTLTCPETLLSGCCSIYCPKPLPCIKCFPHGCGNDNYCGKPRPCVSCFRGCCETDCYCRKPCPQLCRPLAADYFACAGWDTGCADLGAYGASATVTSLQSEVADNNTRSTDVRSESSIPGQPH